MTFDPQAVSNRRNESIPEMEAGAGRILLVEDEPDLAKAISLALAENGWVVDTAADGVSGLSKALSGCYELIVLDLLLPKLNGQQLLARLRESKTTPVLVLTARDSTLDKVGCLNLGADDYVTKPFDLDEFLARIRALLRRSASRSTAIVAMDGLVVNTPARIVTRNGQNVELTAKEFAVLQVLVSHRGQWLSRQQIYERIYGEEDRSRSNVIDVFIARLRQKLGVSLIATRRGVGYTIHG